MPKLIDAHTHINFSIYESSYKDVIQRALSQDIWLVNVGTQKDTSKNAIKIAEEFKEGVYPHTKNFGVGVYATVGLHPAHTNKSFHDKKELGGGSAAREFASRGEDFDYNFYKALAANPKVLAIGECGLDYYRLDGGVRDRQIGAFESQIKLAHEVKKPLMIHCRDGYKDLIDILSAERDKLNENPGIIHFFSGNAEDAGKLMKLGFYFSFGGVTTFTHDYDEVIKYISLEKLILETDAPYVAPAPFRGKINEPSYIKYIAEATAKILNVPFETVAKRTTENAMKVLKLEIRN